MCISMYNVGEQQTTFKKKKHTQHHQQLHPQIQINGMKTSTIVGCRWFDGNFQGSMFLTNRSARQCGFMEIFLYCFCFSSFFWDLNFHSKFCVSFVFVLNRFPVVLLMMTIIIIVV